MAEQEKKDETMSVVGSVITVLSIITLSIIVIFGLVKIFQPQNPASKFIRGFIGKLIGKLFYVLVFLFYFLPIDGLLVKGINKVRNSNFKSWREMNNLNRWGMWGSWKNVALFISMLLGGGGIYLGFNHEGEEWMKYVFMILFGLGVISVLSILGIDRYQESKKYPFPVDGSTREKTSWLFSESANYLKYIIGAGLVLAVACIVLYLFANNILFTVGGTQILMVGFSLLFMSVIYYFLRSNKEVSKTLNKNKALGNLFYIFFIIPCIFHNVIRYIYNQFRHTPNIVYSIFFIELIVVLGYLIIPMIFSAMYTDIKDVKDHDILLKNSIIAAEERKNDVEIMIENKKTEISNFHKNLKKSDIEEIKKKSYDSKEEEEELRAYLLNLNIDLEDKEFKKLISKIQKEIPNLRGAEVELENHKLEIDELHKLKKGGKEVKANVLIRKPIYLEKEKTIERKLEKDEQGLNKYYDFNYNFAISCWVFLRGNKGFKNEFRNILEYNDKSVIKYNAYNNKLKIIMNSDIPNGTGVDNSMKKIYILDDMPLQKWTNIVLNYDSGTLDIFIDSKLVSTTEGVVDRIGNSKMKTGGGVKGGICNLVYFPNSLSKDRININYRILKNRNPPIV